MLAPAKPVLRILDRSDPLATLQTDKWQLYNVRDDFSESTDIAAQNPDKLTGLQALFIKEAEKFHVLPIDDRGAIRLNAAPGVAG